jgi:hypothetical protein
MLEQNLPPSNNFLMIAGLREILGEVGKHIHPKKERTLFSLGGRGHYENPVSDLLAFFMDPALEHGLGTVFLSAFLECLPSKEFLNLPLDRVWISREEETDNGKRIDLVLRGTGWMMLIENKIYHWHANPFLEYKEHFTKLNAGKEPFMVLLSPDGKASEKEWLGVSYENYCNKLKDCLGEALFDRGYSKWVVLARELILHIENELYTAPMEEKAIEFVETHWEEVNQVQKLAVDYRDFLHQELKRLLITTLNDPNAWTKEDRWAIRSFGSRWGQANIAWWYDFAQPKRSIRFTVYVPNPNVWQIQIGQTEFELKNMKPVREGSWIGWRGLQGFGSRAEAMAEFVRLAVVVERMFQTNEPSAEAGAARLGADTR